MSVSGFLIYFITHAAVVAVTLVLPAAVTGYIVWRALGRPRP